MSTIEELNITNNNFAQIRKSYNITVKEIADKCKLTPSVIYNFENFTGKYTETRTKPENMRLITNTLKELINDKLSDIFLGNVNNNNKEEKNMWISPTQTKEISSREITLDELAKEVENRNQKVDIKITDQTKALIDQEKNNEKRHYNRTKQPYDAYDKEKIVTKIRKYCKDNNITLSDFCKMCGVCHSTLAPSSIKVAPILRDSILIKICKATGWDINSFANDIVIKATSNIKIKENKVVPQTIIKEQREEKEEKKSSHDITTNFTNNKDQNEVIQNKKYSFQDGVYYEEYDVVKHVKKVITKEYFLDTVS